ncbi:MAG TPA: hypothetical protein VFS48_07665 [Solirubrobacterales bacterium]|nr:hypothetical protein [Solirubrobacterales bacterium]
MRARMVRVAVAGALVLCACAASSAQADFGIAKWEALTCEVDATPVDPCTSEDVSDFYTQAAGHPDFGITAFELNTGAFEVPEGNVKDIRVELPEGLGVNPEATEQCTVVQLASSTCPPGSLVGTNYLRAIVAAGPPPVATTIPVPVYNVEPPFGVPSMAGFQIPLPGSEPTLLVGDLDPGDQHISFTISDVEPPPDGPPVIGSRLIFNGKAGDGYLTMPSVCAGGQTSILRVDSHQNPGVFVSEPFTTAVGADGCEIVPFEPTIDVTVTGSTDSPEPAEISLKIPYAPGPNEITNSHLRTARVTLPEGMGFNPSAARGLRACTDAQFAKGTNNPIGCPGESKIGTVDVETPSLPPDSIGGTVYVGQPLSDDPTSGNQFRVFINASSPRFGVDVRLVGRVFPDPRTGQLSAVIDDNPQAPFSDFTIHIAGGAGGVLTSPPTCGPHATRTQLAPWTGTAAATPGDSFSLSSSPGGRPCAKTLAERPFAPTLRARPDQRRAGAYSPFRFHFDRPDGAQELRRVELALPPGMVARLRGVEYCSETSIAAAAQRSGAIVKASGACPQKSSLGHLDIDAGSGPRPLGVHGKVYLAGPYKGAPVSLLFVTPALAGPYDLGTVVVRAAAYVDPETAQVRVVSDPIPDVFGGVKLGIRALDVTIRRPRFTVNPTTCREEFSIRSDVFGGGANPADPAAWFKFSHGEPFRANDCRRLRFKPRFFARVFGQKQRLRRAANPRFRAILSARNGDANLQRAAFVLPRAIILDQGHIRTICTRVQLAASECPRAAIYGFARATSPLLDGALKGPVYLTSSDNELPDLLADLQGQVNIRLRGAISAVRGRLKTVFYPTPDVAVRKFILTMRGGNRGLLDNSENLCQRKRFAFLNLNAQNSRRLKTNRLRLNIPGCRSQRR